MILPMRAAAFLIALTFHVPFASGVRQESKSGQDESSRIVEDAVASVMARSSIRDMERLRENLRDRFPEDAPLQDLLGKLKFVIGIDLRASPNACAMPGPKVMVDLTLDALLRKVGRVVGYRLLAPHGEKRVSEHLEAWKEAVQANPRLGPSFSRFTFNFWEKYHHPFQTFLVESYSSTLSDEAKAWVLLHEVAHHRLGHVGSDVKTKADARALETDADQWAFEKMQQLGFPLSRLHATLKILSFLEDLDVQTRHSLPEVLSDHPSWATRAAALAKGFKLEKRIQVPVLALQGQIELTNPVTGGRVHEQVTLAFPSDPNTWGAGMASATVGSTTFAAFVERAKDVGYTLYLRSGDVSCRIVLQEVGDANYRLVVKGMPVTGYPPLDGQGLAYEASLAPFFGNKVSGVSLRTMFAMSLRQLLQLNRKRLRLPAETERDLASVEEELLVSTNELIKAYCVGSLDMAELTRTATEQAKELQAKAKGVLGKERFAAYRAELLDTPAVLASLEQAQQLQRQKEQAGNPADARPAIPRNPPVDFRAVRHIPADFDSLDLKDYMVKTGLYDKFANRGGQGVRRVLTKAVLRGEGVVIEPLSRRMWQSGGTSEGIEFSDAQIWVRNLNQKGYAGFTDWRIPTIEELVLLAEREYFDHGLFISPLFDGVQVNVWACDTSNRGEWRWYQAFNHPAALHAEGVRAFVRVVRTMAPEEKIPSGIAAPEAEQSKRVVRRAPPRFTEAQAQEAFDKALEKAKGEQKDIEEALATFRRISDNFSHTTLGQASTYNVACCYALLSRPQEALNWLDRSFALGYADIKHASEDADLKILRKEPRFKILIEDEPVRAEIRKQGRIDAARGIEMSKRALKLHGEKDYQAAISLFKELYYGCDDVGLTNNSAYNAGCGFALLGDADRAIGWLELAVSKGYSDWKHMSQDSDLDSLRLNPAFQKFCERVQEK